MRSNNFVCFLLAGTGIFFSCLSLADNEGEVTGKNKVSSLCDTGDYIFFTCTTENKKIISLCGKGTEAKTAGVYYRFGRKGKIELDFPENKDEGSIEMFSYNRFPSEVVDAIAVSFDNNDYTYTIYDASVNIKTKAISETDATLFRGVVVSKKGVDKSLASIKCSSGYATNVFPDNAGNKK